MPEEKKKRPLLSFTITIVLIAGAILLFVNKDNLRDSKQYYTYFQNVDGLTISSQVSVNGAIVGKVADVQLLDSGLRVTLSVDPEVKLPNGTLATLGSAGVSGGKALQLTPGKVKGYIEDGGLIISYTEESLLSGQGELGAKIDVAKVMLKAGDSIIGEISSLFGTGAREEVRFQLSELKNQSDEANKMSFEVRGTGEKFAGKIHEINQDVASLANDSKEWSATLNDYEKKSVNLANSTAELGDNMRELQASIKKLKPIFAKANDKDNALGKALNDPQAYHTANKQVKEVDAQAKDVMEYPAAHWFAIFGKNSKKE